MKYTGNPILFNRLQLNGALFLLSWISSSFHLAQQGTSLGDSVLLVLAKGDMEHVGLILDRKFFMLPEPSALGSVLSTYDLCYEASKILSNC